MEIKPLISVIVPVYKVELFLERCLNSIIGQTYRNLEIILVDDGFPDKCPQICDSYAKKDGRIKVIHQKNKGLSGARNAGVDSALGEYIGFVDSDDWIDSDMYASLMQSAIEDDADIVCCGVIHTMDEKVLWELSYEKPQIMTSEEALHDLIYWHTRNTIVCNKIYKSFLFDNIRFPCGEVHEDNAVMYKLIGGAKKISYIDKTCYIYTETGQHNI